MRPKQTVETYRVIKVEFGTEVGLAKNTKPNTTPSNGIHYCAPIRTVSTNYSHWSAQSDCIEWWILLC